MGHGANETWHLPFTLLAKPSLYVAYVSRCKNWRDVRVWDVAGREGTRSATPSESLASSPINFDGLKRVAQKRYLQYFTSLPTTKMIRLLLTSYAVWCSGAQKRLPAVMDAERSGGHCRRRVSISVWKSAERTDALCKAHAIIPPGVCSLHRCHVQGPTVKNRCGCRNQYSNCRKKVFESHFIQLPPMQ